jgi:hypothetical protein
VLEEVVLKQDSSVFFDYPLDYEFTEEVTFKTELVSMNFQSIIHSYKDRLRNSGA